MITIGADVEVFGKIRDGHHVSLCGKIGGTKLAPLQVPDLPAGFMVQEDNVSLEYNIPPATRREEFVLNIITIRDKCKEILGFLELDMAEEASVSFVKEELKDPRALVFGCEPDFSSWTKRANDRPSCPDATLRTCGGHVHVGAPVDMVGGARAMDLYLGVPSVILDNSPASIQRRQLYGKAGAMRPKPYGFEYRVLSNFWMFKKELIAWVWDNTVASLRFDHKKLTKETGNLIQTCINTGDVALAKTLIAKFNIPMPKISQNRSIEDVF